MNAEVVRLFDMASEVPEAERSARLREWCADAAVRGEVESLLEHLDSETAFAAAINGVAESIEGEGELVTGERIGPYRIESLIGRGGMGAVYLVERADGTYRQRAALKVLEASGSELLFDRFQQERRILALLNHPNIAHILDGGQTEGGLPWFSMEYVPGQTIERYCETHRLSVRAMLALFLKVCDGVRHAHQSLVVHRDLKPANIIVTGGGEPKLLDFGIAKVLNPTDLATASTRLLTPEYASPEQIKGDPVTTASDIYSLGAVLFRLLTGRPPHDLREIAPLDAARMITEDRAPKASSVRSGVPQDVDSILAKALQKDMALRYQSVVELARDIRCYLEGRPVEAAPNRFGYRAARYIRRNALIVSLASCAAVSLVAGAVIAIDQAHRAQRRFQQVRQLANVFLFDFEKSIENIPGTLDARRNVAATARHYLEQLAADASGDGSLQREIAVAYEKLADVQRSLQSGPGNETEIEELRRAYQIRRELADDRSLDPSRRTAFISLASRLASAYHMARNSAESAKWDEEAVQLARNWTSEEPAKVEALEAARGALLQQGLRLETAGRAAAALAAMKESLQLAGRALQADPGSRDRASGAATTEYYLANMLLNMRAPAEALTHALRAVALAEPFHRAEPSNPKLRVAYQQALSSTGISYRALSDSDPRALPMAIQHLERAHSIASQTASEDLKNARSQDNLITQCHRLANSLIEAGRLEAAGNLYEQADEAVTRLLAVDSTRRRNLYLAAANAVNHGKLRLRQGQVARARKLLLAADGHFERALALDPFDAVLLELRTAQLHKLAETSERAGDLAGARQFAGRYLDVLSAMIGRDASARDYIGDYDALIATARRLGVLTRHLPAS